MRNYLCRVGFSEPQERADSIQDGGQHFRPNTTDKGGLTLPPIHAFHMIGEDRTLYWETVRQPNLERIALVLAGDWTQDRQSRLGVVCGWRKHQRWPATSLFPPGLRIKGEPYEIAPVGSPGETYHTSFPTGWPQSVAGWQFSGVIPSSSSWRVGLDAAGWIMMVRSCSSIANSSPAFSCAASRIAFGMRTAKLLPHFAKRVLDRSIYTSISSRRGRRTDQLRSPRREEGPTIGSLS